MVNITEITVSRSVRVNTGNYEGTEHFVSAKAELDEFDDEAEIASKVSEIVEKALMVQLIRAYKVRGKKLTASEIGKQHGITYAP